VRFGPLELFAQATFGFGQARSDSAFRRTESKCNFSVRIAVVVPEHNRGGLVGRKLSQGAKQLTAFR
jgi:hypothetical protein